MIWVLTTPSDTDDGWYLLGVYTSKKRAIDAAQDEDSPCWVSGWKENDPKLPVGLHGPVNECA